MNAATIALLLMACALIDCAASAEDAHHPLGKRQDACAESTNEAEECKQMLSAETYPATFCSDCKQVLYDYYEDCNLSESGATDNLERLCSGNSAAAPATVSTISVTILILFAVALL